MQTSRPSSRLFSGVPTVEGAGVHLNRLFGHSQVPQLDPFLLLDHFRSSNPADYEAGFPWHPHRGIETVTYMLDGRVEHGDSLGNEGAIDAGDVQWMTSGGGILHQEMPKRREGLLDGFQLWVNLPADRKMSAPAYRGLRSTQIPTATVEGGGRVRVVAGQYGGVEGPVQGVPVDPTYLDVNLPAGPEFVLPTPKGYTAFAAVIDGEGSFDPASRRLHRDDVALFGDGEELRVTPGEEGVRFLFASGRPLHEPVAWYGPIVMNRQDELRTALVELQRGDFIKHKRVVVED
jgi:redox-sensitive bicupin YhaK (pirin superfamily)